MTQVQKINTLSYIPSIRIGNTFGVTIHISENKIPEDFNHALNRKVILRSVDDKGIIIPADVVWGDSSVSFIVSGKSQKKLGRYITEVTYEKEGGTSMIYRIWDGVIFSLVEHSWQQSCPPSNDPDIKIPMLEISGNIQFGQDGESAYETALRYGFIGSEQEWLASLKGGKGDTGDTGPQGQKGNTGATGPQGQKGDKGDTGYTGPQGQKGDKGDTGAKGDKGDKGDTGANGPAGRDGVDGAKGDTGPQGPKGDPGGGGATIHNELSGLEFENSGHTGFASEAALQEESEKRANGDWEMLSYAQTFADESVRYAMMSLDNLTEDIVEVLSLIRPVYSVGRHLLDGNNNAIDFRSSRVFSGATIYTGYPQDIFSNIPAYMLGGDPGEQEGSRTLWDLQFQFWEDESGNTYRSWDTINIINPDSVLSARFYTEEVAYMPNGASGEEYTRKVARNNSIHIPMPGSVGMWYDGMLFVHWEDQHGRVYNVGDYVKITESLQLKAIWEVEPPKATITYNSNPEYGGSEYDSQTFDTVYMGHSYLVSAPHGGPRFPSISGQPGMIFIEYNTAADGSGKAIIPGTEIVVEEDITLYAQWDGIPMVNMTYLARGGTVSGGADRVSILTPKSDGQHVVRTIEELGITPPAGQIFKRFNKNSWDYDHEAFYPGDIITFPTSIQYLYTIWQNQ